MSRWAKYTDGKHRMNMLVMHTLTRDELVELLAGTVAAFYTLDDLDRWGKDRVSREIRLTLLQDGEQGRLDWAEHHPSDRVEAYRQWATEQIDRTYPGGDPS